MALTRPFNSQSSPIFLEKLLSFEFQINSYEKISRSVDPET